jgi:hypothetical protein
MQPGKSIPGVKIKAPFTFNGEADLDTFDHWTYAVDSWRDWNGISDRMAVKIMVNFMSGKASKFFMKHIAMRRRDWTVKMVYEALFNYCFPTDFKLQLRDKLTAAKQGKNDVRDFERDIETLAARFPDVSKRQIVQIFWNGINQYLRLHLIGKGLSPERSSIQKLVKYASRHKAARRTWENETRHSETHRELGSEWSRWNIHRQSRGSFDDEEQPSREFPSMTSQPDSSGDEELNEELDADNSTVADTTSENEFVPPRRVLLPQDEYDRLRREGRCFNCKARAI